MPPLRNAVGLIHGIERYLYLLEKCDVLGLCKGFRGHIKQFCRSGHQVILNLGELGPRQGGIQEMGYALVARHESPYGIYLILHQGNKRGNDYGRTFHDQGRKLVAQRLPSTGRHYHKGTATRYQMPYYLLLIPFE